MFILVSCILFRHESTREDVEKFIITIMAYETKLFPLQGLKFMLVTYVLNYIWRKLKELLD